MMDNSLVISSLGNSRVKNVVKLRQRSHRDELDLMIVEGYREILRALDNNHFPKELFYCRDLFQGKNNDSLLDRSREAGSEIIGCSIPVFNKLSYRDRPDGLLALAPQVHCSLQDLNLGNSPLLIVAEAIEKPGNLGTILRSSDASGVDAVIVCDRCTDINNPNVVRASIGTIFSLPVIETTSEEALAWLRQKDVKILAATPHASQLYSNTDMTAATAIVVGTEQYGLSENWMERADYKVKIPMLGQSDSLNVASATTILLYEAVRQRGARK